MAPKYILALDEGTTSARAILFDRNASIVAMAQHEFTQIYPRPGWVEHDPMEIWANQYSAVTECIAKSGIDPREIAALGVTNQRETTVVWDRATGRPVANAIVWQCRRTAPECERMIAEGASDMIKSKTGLRPDAYFSATKIAWILDNVEGARERAERGELLFGTIDSWLIWKLTDGKVHVTDRTNASRTMLCNIHTGEWDDELLSFFGVPRAMLPEIRSSSEIYGTAHIMGAEIPISGIAGDQQAALFGQGCFKAGDAKTTYGTGVFLLANTGSDIVESSNGLLSTVAATEAGRPQEYALEGSVFVGGAVVQWLRDDLLIIHEAIDSEYFAKKVPDTGGVYIVPAFTGLGAPHWDQRAKGTITGLTRGTRREHIIRAALESIAYQTDDVLKAMAADMRCPIPLLRVDGGASANDFLVQFQADISGTRVFRPVMKEATAAGAAFLAGLAVGFFSDRTEISRLGARGDTFEVEMDAGRRSSLLHGWRAALAGALANSSVLGGDNK
ncbi:MAG: glycerol kinase GlpK [Clostridia bacterium]|nr:glycerol kinase GlpK [Clostridia bacterium]